MQKYTGHNKPREIDAKYEKGLKKSHYKTHKTGHTDFPKLNPSPKCPNPQPNYISKGSGRTNYTCNKVTKDETKLLMLELGPVDSLIVFRLPCQRDETHPVSSGYIIQSDEHR
jgi:hypothetical protein